MPEAIMLEGNQMTARKKIVCTYTRPDSPLEKAALARFDEWQKLYPVLCAKVLAGEKTTLSRQAKNMIKACAAHRKGKK